MCKVMINDFTFCKTKLIVAFEHNFFVRGDNLNKPILNMLKYLEGYLKAG